MTRTLVVKQKASLRTKCNKSHSQA